MKRKEWKFCPCFSLLGSSMPCSTWQIRSSGAYLILSFFDLVVRSWRHLPYLVTLRSLGIQISLGQVLIIRITVTLAVPV